LEIGTCGAGTTGTSGTTASLMLRVAEVGFPPFLVGVFLFFLGDERASRGVPGTHFSGMEKAEIGRWIVVRFPGFRELKLSASPFRCRRLMN